jgi:uncharacterized protein (DUF1697 family)
VNYFAFLRGINVGGNNMIRMADLRTLCTSLGYDDVRTVLQSGNVIFRAKRASAKQLEEATGVRVILRTENELRAVVANNPFETIRNPSLLLVVFLDKPAPPDAAARLRAIYKGPEIFHVNGREMYVDYVNGVGTSKLTHYLIERTLGVTGTARNWNTVNRLLALSGS